MNNHNFYLKKMADCTLVRHQTKRYVLSSLIISALLFVHLYKQFPMSERKSCKNCNGEFSQDDTYCPHCGQKIADKLTFSVLFSNIIENYFSIDGRFFGSLWVLLTKPGVIARKFVDGQRRKFLHPGRFYLFVSLVFFFIFSFSVQNADKQLSNAIKNEIQESKTIDSEWLATDSLDTIFEDNILPQNSNDLTSIKDTVNIRLQNSYDQGINISSNSNLQLLDSLIATDATLDEKYQAMGMSEDAGAFTKNMYSAALKLYENQGRGILKVMYDMFPLVMFLLLPLFALLLNLFLWKKSTFAFHLVFSLYYFTFIFMSLSQ